MSEPEPDEPKWFFDWDGQPTTKRQWHDLYEQNRVLKQDHVQDARGSKYQILTMWMGTDPKWPGPDVVHEYGPPRIFLTIVYRDGEQMPPVPTADRQEAIRVHELTVTSIDGLKQTPKQLGVAVARALMETTFLNAKFEWTQLAHVHPGFWVTAGWASGRQHLDSPEERAEFTRGVLDFLSEWFASRPRRGVDADLDEMTRRSWPMPDVPPMPEGHPGEASEGGQGDGQG